MRVILTGGGTGGHIYPAIAIGQAILREWPQAELLFVGTKVGLESKIVPEAGIPFATIEVEGWKRQLSFQALKAGWKALVGTRQAARLVREFSPQLVIGTGGYVCLPVVWAAARQKVPTLIHEQNALPGLTNKFLSRIVERVMLTFPESSKHFPEKVQGKLRFTGLPIRPGIMKAQRNQGLAYFALDPKKTTLLGLGGSRGARSINQAMQYLINELAQEPGLQIIHITGADGYEEFLQGLNQSSIEVVNSGKIIVRPYLHQMEYALACADLCVARAGATFLAEMTAKGLPAILVPYPYAAENHQEYNARSLVERNAAIMIKDRELTGGNLTKVVKDLLTEDEKRRIMADNSKKAGKPEAIENILQVIKQYI